MSRWPNNYFINQECVCILQCGDPYVEATPVSIPDDTVTPPTPDTTSGGPRIRRGIIIEPEMPEITCELDSDGDGIADSRVSVS